MTARINGWAEEELSVARYFKQFRFTQRAVTEFLDENATGPAPIEFNRDEEFTPEATAIPSNYWRDEEPEELTEDIHAEIVDYVAALDSIDAGRFLILAKDEINSVMRGDDEVMKEWLQEIVRRVRNVANYGQHGFYGQNLIDAAVKELDATKRTFGIDGIDEEKFDDKDGERIYSRGTARRTVSHLTAIDKTFAKRDTHYVPREFKDSHPAPRRWNQTETLIMMMAERNRNNVERLMDADVVFTEQEINSVPKNEVY